MNLWCLYSDDMIAAVMSIWRWALSRRCGNAVGMFQLEDFGANVSRRWGCEGKGVGKGVGG